MAPAPAPVAPIYYKPVTLAPLTPYIHPDVAPAPAEEAPAPVEEAPAAEAPIEVVGKAVEEAPAPVEEAPAAEASIAELGGRTEEVAAPAEPAAPVEEAPVPVEAEAPAPAAVDLRTAGDEEEVPEEERTGKAQDIDVPALPVINSIEESENDKAQLEFQAGLASDAEKKAKLEAEI